MFEPRYLNLVSDALGQGRLLAMVQPAEPEPHPRPRLHDLGCLGRISTLTETEDGRLLITLTGIARFRIIGEMEMVRGYRRVLAEYADFRGDLEHDTSAARIDRGRLQTVMHAYFHMIDAELDWKAVESAPDGALVDALSMLCPFEPRDKQALLAAANVADRAELVVALMEMALFDVTRPGARQ